jgi:O-antigen ligase
MDTGAAAGHSVAALPARASPLPNLLGVLALLLAVPFGVLAVLSPSLALAAALGLAFTGLAAYSPAVAVVAFALLALLETVPPLSGSPANKAAGAVLVVVLIRKHAPLWSLARERPWLALTVLFLATWGIASTLWAVDTGAAITNSLRLAMGLLFIFVVYGSLRERRHVTWLAYALIAGGLATALVGVFGLTAVQLESGRLVGGAGDPNELASVLVAAVALAIFALMAPRSMATKVLLVGALVGMTWTFLLTGSRGGLVALAIAIPTAIAFGGAFRARLVAIFTTVVLLCVGYFAYLATPAEVDRILDPGAEGGSGRVDVWYVASAAAADHPLLGTGVGNFPVVEPTYATATLNLPEVRFIVDTPLVVHNTYLEMLTELGLPGLGAFLAIVIASLAAVVRAIRTARASGDLELEFLARGTLVALAGVLGASFFFSGQYEKPLWLLVGLAVSLAGVTSRSAALRSV